MIEYKGYKVGQASNHHVWITKDDRMVLHSQCNKPKTDDELRKMVDNYIEILSDELCEELFDEDEDSEV